MSGSLVSVVITAHNDADWVGRAIGSVKKQTYPDVEIIVVDDGSTDETSAVVNNHLEEWKGHKLIQKENGGLGSARASGASVARGEFLCFLDADDEYREDKIEKQVKALQEVGTCIMLSGARIRDEMNRVAERHISGRVANITEQYVRGKGLPAANASMMVTRSDYVHWGGFDSAMRRHCEEDLLLRVLNNGSDIWIVEEPLYLVHAKSGTNRSRYEGRAEYVRSVLERAGLLAKHGCQEKRDRILRFSRTFVRNVCRGAVRHSWQVRREMLGVFIEARSECRELVSWSSMLPLFIPIRLDGAAFECLKRTKKRVWG